MSTNESVADRCDRAALVAWLWWQRAALAPVVVRDREGRVVGEWPPTPGREFAELAADLMDDVTDD